MRSPFTIVWAAPALLASAGATMPTPTLRPAASNAYSQGATGTSAGDNASLRQSRSVPDDAGLDMTIANEILWNATKRAIAAGVRYQLGDKSSASGEIDCSGWVAEITLKAFTAINQAAAPEVVFDGHGKRILRNDSSAIITGLEAATGFALDAPMISADTLREGMLVGINFSTHAWEEDRRAHGIDHIVQVVRDPASGRKFISQSSGSGRGVNMVPLEAWLQARTLDGLIPAGRLRAVDPFLLAVRLKERRESQVTAQPAIDHRKRNGLEP